MNYTDKIEAYTAGEMSNIEQFVFEQELTENTALKEAYEAHLLTEALLGFTANNLSEAAILGNTPVPQVEVSIGTSKTIYYGVGLLAFCLIGWFSFIYTPSSKKITPVPTIETKQAIATPNTPSAKETIIFQDPIQEVKTAPKPVQKPTPAKTATKKVNQPRPIAAIQKKVQAVNVSSKKIDPTLANLSSTKQVITGEAIVFTAGESITLEPGFSVEAGGSFQAKIEK